VRIDAIVFDCRDAAPLARFWADVLGWSVAPYDEVERLEDLGASIHNWAEGDGGVWCVMLDPEGNEFCVMPPSDEVA
jgi:hypothetical protein